MICSVLNEIEKGIKKRGTTDAIYYSTLEENVNPKIPPGTKQGRPKYKWVARAMMEYWNGIRKKFI